MNKKRSTNILRPTSGPVFPFVLNGKIFVLLISQPMKAKPIQYNIGLKMPLINPSMFSISDIFKNLKDPSQPSAIYDDMEIIDLPQ